MRKLSFFLICLGLVYFLQFSGGDEDGIKFASPYYVSAEEASDKINPIKEMVQGDEDAPIEMIEYASFTCLIGATFHANVYPKLKINYIDKGFVKFVYREVYFDKYGVWASMIARCAGQDKFFGMTDQIYRKQSDWAHFESNIAIVTKPRKIGLLAG